MRKHRWKRVDTKDTKAKLHRCSRCGCTRITYTDGNPKFVIRRNRGFINEPATVDCDFEQVLQVIVT